MKWLHSGILNWVTELLVPGVESTEQTIQLQQDDQLPLAVPPAVLDKSSVPAVTVFVPLSSNPITGRMMLQLPTTKRRMMLQFLETTGRMKSQEKEELC